MQPNPLHRSIGTGAVTGARRARHQVPEVVEPAVWVLGVFARPLRGDRYDALVNEDERVHQRVWDSQRRQGFEDFEAHHGSNVRILHKDDLALGCLDLGGHDVIPSLWVKPETSSTTTTGDAARGGLAVEENVVVASFQLLR